MGWYHSHPGYGCWLSGIDVGTQMSGQQGQEPWLSVVVDPLRTMSAGAPPHLASPPVPRLAPPPPAAPLYMRALRVLVARFAASRRLNARALRQLTHLSAPRVATQHTRTEALLHSEAPTALRLTGGYVR